MSNTDQLLDSVLEPMNQVMMHFCMPSGKVAIRIIKKMNAQGWLAKLKDTLLSTCLWIIWMPLYSILPSSTASACSTRKTNARSTEESKSKARNAAVNTQSDSPSKPS